MRKIRLLVASVVLCVAPAAFAQVTGVVTGDTAQVVLNGVTTSVSGQNIANQQNNSGTNQFGNYQISTLVQPNDIDFANNSTTVGDSASVTTTTSIAVTLTNNTSVAVAPRIQSTILPGGFGFYVVSPGDNPTYNERTETVGDINQTPELTAQTFDSFSALNGTTLASASFSLVIASDGDPIDTLTGSLTLTTNPIPISGMNPDPPPIVTLTLGGLASSLNGLAMVTPMVTPLGDASAVGYQWDTTDLLAGLPISQGPLAPGASTTLTYTTTVSASTFASSSVGACGGPLGCPTILAYSGFGDPIGKASGAKGVADPYFPTFDLSLPTFDPATGVVSGLDIEKIDPSIPLAGQTPAPFVPIPYSVSGPVPEPDAWMLMLVGMGFAGAVLRGRADRRFV